MAAGDLLSLTVRDAGAIDPDAGGIGADGSGWTADIVIDGLSAGGTVDPSKLVLTVEDPGYDATGAAVTRTRTIRGTVPIRRQYPNNAQRMINVGSGQLTIMVGLDDLIYSGSTITAVDIGSGFYPGAATGSPASVTNASTRAYPHCGPADLGDRPEGETDPVGRRQRAAQHGQLQLFGVVRGGAFGAPDSGRSPRLGRWAAAEER